MKTETKAKIKRALPTIILLIGLCFMGYLYFTKPGRKEQITEKTILKAQFSAGQWATYTDVFMAQARKLASGKMDSIELKKTADTIALVTNIIIHNVTDSNINPIYKK